MSKDDYYQQLGVSRYASREALRRAFRLRLFDVHPDRNPLDVHASERARNVIEAYASIKSTAELAPGEATPRAAVEPEYVYQGSAAQSASSGALRALTVAALLVLMAWLVLTLAREGFGGGILVFRPNPAALSATGNVRAFPVIVEPSILDCLEWYSAQQYQLSLAGDWAAREMLKTYDEAARRAALRNDSNGVRFYRSAIEGISRTHSAVAF